MYDVMFVIGSVAFFALMLAYVRVCERLGANHTPSDERQQ